MPQNRPNEPVSAHASFAVLSPRFVVAAVGVAFFANAVLLAAGPQAPGTRVRQAPRQDTATRAGAPVRDIARPVVQPPPTIVVEAQSQWPAVVLGVAGLILLGLQLRIMARQTDAMNRQTSLLDKQTALLDQQAAWQREEALGTFYRIAFDLVDEFREANVMTGTPIPANFDTHPRQMLREASRLFAPLGNDVVRAIAQAAMRLDEYFLAAEAYDGDPRGRDGAARWQTVQVMREQVGNDLDLASMKTPAELRWKYDDGTDYRFRRLCSMHPGPATAIGGPAEDGEGEA